MSLTEGKTGGENRVVLPRRGIVPAAARDAFNEGSGFPWYAVRTRSRHEKVAVTHLKQAGFSVFLPLVTRLQKWKDRRKAVDFPLFPGYCFVQCDNTDFRKVRMTPGAVDLVGIGREPMPVAEKEIRAVWQLVHSTLPYDPVPMLEPGMRVRVKRGPLEDVEGILIRKVPRARLIISIELLRRGAVVEIDSSDVERL